MSTTRTTAAAVLAAAALAAGAAGCGGSPSSGASAATQPTSAATAAPSTSTPPTTAPVTTVAPTTLPATPSSTAAPRTVACRSGRIAVSLGSGGAGVGHEGITLLFRNTGAVACELDGYPGVALLDASGRQVLQAVRTPSGYLGGLAAGTSVPPTLTVDPGQVVSALLEGTDVPAGTATSCPYYPAVLVTPPNQTVSTRLVLTTGSGTGPDRGLPGCSPPQVHPVVPGTTGSQG